MSTLGWVLFGSLIGVILIVIVVNIIIKTKVKDIRNQSKNEVGDDGKVKEKNRNEERK